MNRATFNSPAAKEKVFDSPSPKRHRRRDTSCHIPCDQCSKHFYRKYEVSYPVPFNNHVQAHEMKDLLSRQKYEDLEECDAGHFSPFEMYQRMLKDERH